MTASRTWRPSGPRFIPLAAIPFVLVAALPIILAWDEWARGFFDDPIDWLATWFLGILPSVAVPLIGAAIVIRHPRVRRSAPMLLWGAALLAAQVAGVLLIDRILDWLVPDPFGLQEDRALVAGALSIAATIVGAFGLGYLGRGLAVTRRMDDVGPTSLFAFVALAIAVITTAVSVGAGGSFTPDGTMEGVVLMAVAAVGLLAGFAVKLAVGYLAVTTLRGLLAGEPLRLAWGLAAVGSWLFLVALLAVTLVPLLRPFPPDDAVLTFRIISLLSGVGGVALLAAFAIGLPDIEDITWYDLADLDAAELAAAPPTDPFDDDDAVAGDLEVVELGNRRLGG